MRTLPAKYLSEIMLPKDAYDVDLAVLDRYQSFSAEILRLALLGLAGYGFLIANIVLKLLGEGELAIFFDAFPTVQYALAVGTVSLALCAMSALGHRYFSTDAISHQVRRLRLLARVGQLEEAAPEREGLESIAVHETESLQHDLSKCRWLLLGAAVLLVVGAVSVAWSFAAVLFLAPAL